MEGAPDGIALDGAVVSLHSPAASAAARPEHADVVQRGDGFHPRVLPVAAASEVRFSSTDRRRHELYAFSRARPFAFPLHEGLAAQTLHFDTPGVVEYGCAIHESMIGYVVVLDTPYFATTDATGRVRLDAPEGDYTLQVWHERQAQGQAPLTKPVHVEAGAMTRIALPVRPLRATALPQERRLHEMRERFRRFQHGG
ncbi:MAG: methylamine utilization protein [Luteimonas sp.]